MKILITGATGFVGQVIVKQAIAQGHSIATVGRKTIAGCRNYFWDASIDQRPKIEGVFDRVIHVAGKAHSVPRTESEKQAFFDINVKGLERVLESLDQLSFTPPQIVLISTVAVYGQNTGEGIDESRKPIPVTAYGESKLKAERLIQDWCISRNVVSTILRLPLVIGSNPPGNLGEMIKGIQNGRYISISNNTASKSMVVCDDVASLVLQSNLATGIFNLTDGINPSFTEVEEAIIAATGGKALVRIPKWILLFPALVGSILQRIGLQVPLDQDKLKKITSTLTFNDDLAKVKLGWTPTHALDFLSNPSNISPHV